MTNKLENVKAAIEHLEKYNEIHRKYEEIFEQSTYLMKAILEKRGGLLVPVEPSDGMSIEGNEEICNGLETGKISSVEDVYKAMTQAVDQDELLKEILG